MKIECTVDGSIRDYSTTGNRPENSLTPVHPPIHLAPTRQQSQTPTVAIIVDTPENCQAAKPTTASVETRAQSKIKEEPPRPLDAPAPSGPFERWWGAIRPTFVVCWDDPHTGQRAYQFLLPDIYRRRGKFPPDCEPVNKDDWHHAWHLRVWVPLLDKHAVLMGIQEGVSVVPARDDWPAWIDEVLPRP